jgi:phage terminase large subunit-like protein
MSGRDHVQGMNQYIDGVLSGNISACRLVKCAVRRHKDDLLRVGSPEFPFYFSERHATRACNFFELLKHIQGPKADSRLVLEGWQQFIIASVFGWLRVSTNVRRFRRVYICVPRGSGKTLIAAGVSLLTGFADLPKEGGADVVCTANSLSQSKLVLGTAQSMLRKDKKLTAKLGVEVRQHEILQLESVSKVHGMASKGQTLEGISLHAGIIDELHAAKDRAVFDSLSTATAKREQSLLFVITTAGLGDISTIGYEVDTFCRKVLEKEDGAQDESFFGIIYTIDEELEEQWDNEIAWIQANPNYGVSVNGSVLAEEANRARQIPSQQPSFRAKYLNIWSSSATEEPFLTHELIRKCYDAKLSEVEFVGQECAYGLDLASRLDLCAAVRVHARRIEGQTHYYAFCKAWLPSATVAKSINASYRGWIAQKHLVETTGSITDLDVVEEFVMSEFERFKIRDLSFDPLQSNQLITHLCKRTKKPDGTFVEVAQFAKFLTVGMTELEGAVAAGRMHTNSPLLIWTLSNLRAKRVSTGLCYPVRPKDHSLKIDAAVALCMALRSCAVVPLDESKKPVPQCFFV